MDYRRIQIILIVTFSILNLYLLTILLEKNDELNLGDPSTAVNLEEGLRNDDIETRSLSKDQIESPIIKTDKSKYLDDNMATLKNQTTRMENNLLLSALSEPIPLDFTTDNVPLSERIQPIQDFIAGGYVLKGEEFLFLSYQPNNRRIVYVQRAEGELGIADGTGSLIFYLNADNEVISYEQTYAGEVEVQGRPRTVVSEQAAIESLYLNNQIPTNSRIQLLTLSYYQTLNLTDMNIYSPMWYVEITRANMTVLVKRVDALTGNIINAPMITDELEPESSSSEDGSSLELNMEQAEETIVTDRMLIAE